ncbi:MAG: tRNA-dependent cyclodipeptide synthase [Bacteriovoracia bacterium]
MLTSEKRTDKKHEQEECNLEQNMNHLPLDIVPLLESSSIPMERKDHICFGISPFNSLFSEEYLSSLVYFALKNFKSFHFFLPDAPTIHTLEALGYSESDSRKKMKKQINWLRNKMHKALAANGLSSEKENYILDAERLEKNDAFQDELKTVYGFFDFDPAFRKDCLDASRWVLQNKMEEKFITEQVLLKAVKYFLFEIPLFAATNKIVQSPTSIFCYHQHISFHEKLYQNLLSYTPSFGQGYGMIQQNT